MSEEKDNLNSRESALKALESLRMRLLGLTARNRLINFRHTKKGSLRIIDELLLNTFKLMKKQVRKYA